MLAKIVVIFEQAGANLLSGLTPDVPEAEGQHELAFASCEVNLPGTRNVAVLCARVFPFHLEMLGEVLPSIGGADKSDGHLFPRRRRCQRQGCAAMLSEKYRQTFVIANPSRIPIPEIGQMRRKQRVKAIVGKQPLERFETNLL